MNDQEANDKEFNVVVSLFIIVSLFLAVWAIFAFLGPMFNSLADVMGYAEFIRRPREH